jgi:hypothetical protein
LLECALRASPNWNQAIATPLTSINNPVVLEEVEEVVKAI